jgi:hypothetical protein
VRLAGASELEEQGRWQGFWGLGGRVVSGVIRNLTCDRF